MIRYGKTIFETNEWIDTLKNSYSYTPYASRGAFFLHVKSRLFGNRLISLPFSDYGRISFIGRDQIEHMITQTHAEYVEARIPEWKWDLIHDFCRNNFIIAKIYKTFLLDISKGQEHIWGNLNKKVRNAIRYSKKKNIEIRRIEDLDDLKIFYKLYLRGSRELGSPPHPYKFYELLFRNLRDKILLDVAFYNQIPIASILVLLGDRWANFWQNISIRKYRRFNASYLLLWNTVAELSEKDFLVFDFGRTREGTGIHFFKRRWGGIEQNIYHLVYSEGEKIKTPDPRDRKYVYLSKIWRRMPLKAAEFLGTRIIGGIAL